MTDLYCGINRNMVITMMIAKIWVTKKKENKNLGHGEIDDQFVSDWAGRRAWPWPDKWSVMYFSCEAVTAAIDIIATSEHQQYDERMSESRQAGRRNVSHKKTVEKKKSVMINEGTNAIKEIRKDRYELSSELKIKKIQSKRKTIICMH